jgi:hypothetical protein
MKKNWFLRVSQWAWTPLIIGVIVCLGVTIAANELTAEAAVAGVGLICFVWLAAVKGFIK